ncbi:zinc ribbon domain-containing protein, partial [Streptomyces sp. WAC04114]|nr:zinc ribbon domain-containing protein [Streptomyces sp. WAC04114]
MTTPQNCADCGTRAEPGQSFCDACGSVLSWTDGAARTAGNAGPDDAARGSGSTGAADAAGAAGGAAGAAGTTPSPTASATPATPAISATPATPASTSAPTSASAPASVSAAPASAPAPADAHPGWDAFSRPDGGAGLPRTPRDRTGPATAAHTTASRTTAPPVPGTTEEASARATQGPEPGTAFAQPADHRPGTPADETTPSAGVPGRWSA